MSDLSIYIIISIIISFAGCSPLHNDHVKFIPNPKRSSRHIEEYFDISLPSSHGIGASGPDWTIGFPPSYKFDHHANGHISPDFSNGLDYPDPYLLTGPAAKRAVWFLYSKPLFFGDIKHTQSLLRLQDQRIHNGLAGNNLGSLRTYSPWYRFKKGQSRYF